MSNKLEIFKKRLIYRASYRGTKEMDILLSNFVNKYINEFNENMLLELEKFLNFEDEIILNFYNFDIKEKNWKIKYQKYLKNLKFNGGEGWDRTHERVARCWFSRPVLSTAQPPLLEINKLPLILSK